jgi:hypothetical protein
LAAQPPDMPEPMTMASNEFVVIGFPMVSSL